MMMSNHYASQPSAHYAYGQPQGPPSPPMDETSKCSLPSISNLLGLADGGSPTTEHSPASQQGKRHRRDQFQRPLTCRPASSHKTDARPDSSHYNNVAARSGALPPTPPMSSDASFEGYHSPSTKSVSQLSAASNYFYDAAPAMAHVEPEAQRQQMAPRLPIQAPSYAQSAFAASSYMGPPAMASYYPAMQPTPPPQPQVSGLYYQRPLPHVSTTHPVSQPEFQAHIPSRPSLPCHSALRCPRLARTPGNTTTISRRLQQPPSLSPRTATSARPATRPSPGPVHCAFTATPTPARSPSSALMPVAARPSASAAT